jgi:hypothetical protein
MQELGISSTHAINNAEFEHLAGTDFIFRKYLIFYRLFTATI